MRNEPKVVEVQSDSASPMAWIVGIVVVVAAVLIVLFYWHPWNSPASTNSTTNSTTNSSTTVTQPGSNGNTQPH